GHTGAGLVVPDIPLAYGQIMPSLSPGDLDGYTRSLIDSDIRIAADGPVTASQITIHLLHRYWGVITGIVLVRTAHRLFWSSRQESRQRRPGRLGGPGRLGRLGMLGLTLAGLTVLQITLGVFTVLTGKAVEITTAHVALGAMLLAVSVLSALHCYRTHGFRRIGSPARVGEVMA
ncbi:MAG TPA: COX15/CtaA family protein, partial [Bacteroidota bacterium]|nr:COX15/CtaA family protein [Bacteroidota bacterium]